MKPRLSPGLELFFWWLEEAFFEIFMLLAFLDDVVAVVAAEVGEPRLGYDGFAVGGGGFEVTFGDRIAFCFIACVDTRDVSVLEHP